MEITLTAEMAVPTVVLLSLNGHEQRTLYLSASVCPCEAMEREKRVRVRNETILTMTLMTVAAKNEQSKKGGIDSVET